MGKRYVEIALTAIPTPSWSPSMVQIEIGEVEARHHNTADQTGLGTMRPGPLPMPGRYDQLGVVAGFDIRSEQQSHGVVPVRSELQSNRAAPMVHPELSAANGVPCRLLAG